MADDFEDDPFVQLQQARKALRHNAHVYAHTKKGSNNYEAAVTGLEQAAMAFAMASMIFGSKADTAPPASAKRMAWDKATDPEPEV